MERKRHKQRQKVLDIFEVHKYFQVAETEWLRRQEGMVGEGRWRKADVKGFGCHIKVFGFYSLGKVSGRWNIIIRFSF